MYRVGLLYNMCGGLTSGDQISEIIGWRIGCNIDYLINSFVVGRPISEFRKVFELL